MKTLHEPKIIDFLDQCIPHREKWIRRNDYYYNYVARFISSYITHGSSVCHVGCDTPYLLKRLTAAKAVGMCVTEKQTVFCNASDPDHSYITTDNIHTIQQKFDFIIITSLGYFFDIHDLLIKLQPLCHFRTKLIIVNFNFLWEPVFHLGEKVGLRMPQPLQRQNMVPTNQIINLLHLCNFQLVKWSSCLLLPIKIPFVSWLLNKFLAPNFPFRYLSLTDVVVSRPIVRAKRPVACSVIVPCKNEKGHIEAVVSRMPQLADETEIILVDDKSMDGTGEEMRRCAKLFPDKNIKIIDGPGISKGEAVRAGCREASGEILAILDADLAVAPEELPKCVAPLLDGVADFVNTVRFVYPQQGKAMRWLNIAGNRGFAFLFTFLLRQRIGDTLCGTKVFWREDYKNIDDLKDYWIWRDRWGDFEQLLGASKLGLKIVDVPVHYMQRSYGETKMKNRFSNGWHMLKLCIGGLFRLRMT